MRVANLSNLPISSSTVFRTIFRPLLACVHRCQNEMQKPLTQRHRSLCPQASMLPLVRVAAAGTGVRCGLKFTGERGTSLLTSCVD